MHIEDILKDVGGFGLYQKILVGIFLVPANIVIPWFSLNMIFMSSTPDHWCNVPEVSHSNLSLDVQKQLLRPPSDPFCSIYDVNYSQILESGNWTIDTRWSTKQCRDGWHYDTSDYEATATSRWNMVCKDSHYSSLALSMVFMGNIFGTPLYGLMSDRFGRKPTFLVLAVIVAVTEIGSILSPSFILFLVLRLLNGSTMFSIYGVAYIISLELVTPEFRACINMLTITCWSLGLCLLSLIAWLTADWIRLSIATSSAATALLLYWKFLPESPNWLVSQGRYDEAAAILSQISKTNGKVAQQGDSQLMQKIQKLGDEIKAQKGSEEKPSLADLFKYPTLRKNFLLITFCWVGALLPYYGLQINARNLVGSQFLNFFLVSLVELPAYFITWFSMERIGRRWCTISGFAVSALFCSVSCAMHILFPLGYTTIGVGASLIAKAGTAAAYMTVFQQSSELFPTFYRSIGMGMSYTMGMGSTLLVPYIVHLAEFGTFLPFLLFSLISFVASISAAFLPETLNIPLPQTTSDIQDFQQDCKFCFCCR